MQKIRNFILSQISNLADKLLKLLVPQEICVNQLIPILSNNIRKCHQTRGADGGLVYQKLLRFDTQDKKTNVTPTRADLE